MLNGGGDNVLVLFAEPLCGAEDRPVVGFGTAGGEEYPVWFRAKRSGNGISVAPYPLAYEYGSGCALLELGNVDTSFDMVLLWRKDNTNPSLKLFLDSLPDGTAVG